MIDEIFNGLEQAYLKNVITDEVSYYFSLGDFKRTVVLTPESCTVSKGRTVETADCVCKTTPEFFQKIWLDGYRPDMKDFLSGTIKSNDPGSLQVFLDCFGK